MMKKKIVSCSFLGSRSSSSDHRKTSVGEAKTVISQAMVSETMISQGVVSQTIISQTSVGNASISQAMDGETSSIWMGGKDWSSCYMRSGSRNDMDRGGSLFGSQTSSSSVIESSLESSFGSSDIFSIVKVGGSDLRSLYVIVDWMEGVRTESCVFSSLCSSEGSLESSLGLSNLRSVLNGSSGSHGQEGTDELGRGCSG